MIKDEISRLCRENNITISKLEDEIGIARSSIARWDKSSPRIDNVKKVAAYFGVSVDSLLVEDENTEYKIRDSHVVVQERRHEQRRVTDNDASLILDELQAILKNYGADKMPLDNRKIPIVSTIKCGNNGIAYEDIDGYIMVDESLHGDLIVLRTQGDSMIDAGINDNDLAIIRIQDDIESGEIAAVLIDEEEATLKRVVKLPVGIALEGANPSYKTRYFTGEDINRVRIIGKLVEIRKRF